MPLRPARVGRVGVIGHPVAKTAVVAKAVTPGPVARREDRGRGRGRHPGPPPQANLNAKHRGLRPLTGRGAPETTPGRDPSASSGGRGRIGAGKTARTVEGHHCLPPCAVSMRSALSRR